MHGLTGIIGSISIGFFADKSLNPSGGNGLFYGENSAALLGSQCIAILVAAVYSAFWTFVLCLVIEKSMGLRVSQKDEIEGLDHHHTETSHLQGSRRVIVSGIEEEYGLVQTK